MKVKLLCCVQLLATPWTVAYHAPPSLGFSRQEYWSGLPFPSPGDLPNTGIKPGSPTLQADALPSEPPGKLDLAQPKVNNKNLKKKPRSFPLSTLDSGSKYKEEGMDSGAFTGDVNGMVIGCGR